MNNKFINNNGVNLQNTNKKLIKKTKVESHIETLKQQEQAIINELDWWETKNKSLDDLLANLAEVEKFGTDLLSELVSQEREKENLVVNCLEKLIKNKTEFALQFSAGRESFYQLVWQKIEFKVSYLRSKLNDLQNQLAYQERIFVRIETRRQNKTLLICQYKKSIGCLGVYRCANCQTNYSANNNQVVAEVVTP